MAIGRKGAYTWQGKLLVAFLLIASAFANCEEDHGLVRFNMGLALAYGGDDLARVKFENEKDQKISGGGGVKAYMGMFIDPHIPFKALLNIGLHAQNEEAENGKASMERFFLDTILLYQPHRFHRLGLGTSYHLQPTLAINDQNNRYTQKYDNAIGWLIQYEYVLKPKSKGVPTIGLRYTNIDYRPEKSKTAKVDGSHISLHINYAF